VFNRQFDFPRVRSDFDKVARRDTEVALIIKERKNKRTVAINTNSAANQSAFNLGSSNAMLPKSLDRLSIGSKIVNPADDAGGLAVSMRMVATRP